MAFEQPGLSITLEASTDLSASQFCGVDVDTNGQAALPSAGGRCVGFLQNKPAAAGEAATIVVDGITKALVGTGGVSAGDVVQVLATGGVTTAASGDHAVGIALATNAAGELTSILLTPTGGGGIIV